MAIVVTAVRDGPYYPNGVTTTFPYSFKADTAARVRVFSLIDGVELTIDPALYVVAPTGGDEEGGAVVFAAPPLAGLGALYVELVPEWDQPASLIDRGFLPSMLNPLLDREALRGSWLRERVARALLVPVGEAGLVLPPIVDRAGRVPAFDDDGNLYAPNVSALNLEVLAGISGSIVIVAARDADIGTVVANLQGANTIGTVAASIANVNTVGASIANVNTVAAVAANVNTVAAVAANVNTVAAYALDINTVAASIVNVNLAAVNMAAIIAAPAQAAAAANSAAAAAVSEANALASGVTGAKTVLGLNKAYATPPKGYPENFRLVTSANGRGRLREASGKYARTDKPRVYGGTNLTEVDTELLAALGLEKFIKSLPKGYPSSMRMKRSANGRGRLISVVGGDPSKVVHYGNGGLLASITPTSIGAVPLPDSPTFYDIVVFIGQSNARKQGGNGAQAIFPPAATSWRWNGDSGDTGAAMTLGTGVTDLSDTANAWAASLLPAFGRSLWQKNGHGCFTCNTSKGGTSIVTADAVNGYDWTPTGVLRAKTETELAGLKAWLDANGYKGKYRVAAVIITQGENDTGAWAAWYAAAESVRAWVHGTLVDPTVPFLVNITGTRDDDIDNANWANLRSEQRRFIHDKKALNVFAGWQGAYALAAEGHIYGGDGQHVHWDQIGKNRCGWEDGILVSQLAAGVC